MEYKKSSQYINDEEQPIERQMNAKLFLEEYNIENIITEMINCLLHEKDLKSPLVFMIKYLAGLLTEEERKNYKIEIPGPYPTNHPIVEYKDLNKRGNSLVKDYLTSDLFMKIKNSYSKFGNNIKTITNVYNTSNKKIIGCLIPDKDCISKFNLLYNPIICKVHNLDLKSLKEYDRSFFFINELSNENLKDINLNNFKGLNKISVSISRNLSNKPFIDYINGEDRIADVVDNLINYIENNPKFNSNYYNDEPKFNQIKYSTNKREIDSKILSDINFDFDFFYSIIKENFYQKQRIVYERESEKYYKDTILINFCNNIQIINTLNKKKNNNQITTDNFINQINHLVYIYRNIDYSLSFEFDHNFGYLTSDIKLLGKGFTITTEVNLDEAGVDINDNNFDNKLKEFEQYSEKVFVRDDNTLIFSSSPKISQESFVQFLTDYFIKLEKFQKKKD